MGSGTFRFILLFTVFRIDRLQRRLLRLGLGAFSLGGLLSSSALYTLHYALVTHL
jgi:hypothetical protein